MKTKLSVLLTLLLIFFQLQWLGCSSENDNPVSLYESSTEELELLVAEKESSERQFVIAELLTRDIVPSKKQKLANEILANESSYRKDVRAIALATVIELDKNKSGNERLPEAMRLARKSGNPRAIAFTLYVSGMTHRHTEWVQCAQTNNEIIQKFIAYPSCSDICLKALNKLGMIAMAKGALLRSRDYFSAAKQLQNDRDDLKKPAVTPFISLGFLDLDLRRFDDARDSLKRALECTMELDSQAHAFLAFKGLAICSLRQGRIEESLQNTRMALLHGQIVHRDSVIPVQAMEKLLVLKIKKEELDAKEKNSIVAEIQALDTEDTMPRSRNEILLIEVEALAELSELEKVEELIEQHVSEGSGLAVYQQIAMLELLAEAYQKEGGHEKAVGVCNRIVSLQKSVKANLAEKENDFLESEKKWLNSSLKAAREKIAAKSEFRAFLFRCALGSALIGLFVCVGLVGEKFSSRRTAKEYESRQNDEKKELLTDLAEMEFELHQKRRLESIGKLTGSVVHDFNNLLTVIINSNESLLVDDDSITEHQRKIILQSSKAAKVGARITSSLLSYSRNQSLRPELIELRDFFEGIEDLLRQTVGKKGNLVFSYPAEFRSFLVRIDYGQLTTAMINLCCNSRDSFSENKTDGLIEIDVRPKEIQNNSGDLETFYQINTRDNGSGMDSQQVERACEPFFTTKSNQSGSGLGLSSVDRFVRQSGGEIKIESQPGYGTTVSILIPAASSFLQIEKEIVDSRKGNSVLVVDDDRSIRGILKTLLENHGYRATCVENSEIAKSLLKEGFVPDLVITDIKMRSQEEGVEFARWLEDCFPDVRVLLMSGFYDSESFDGFEVVCKPFSAEDVLLCLTSMQLEQGTKERTFTYHSSNEKSEKGKPKRATEIQKSRNSNSPRIRKKRTTLKKQG